MSKHPIRITVDGQTYDLEVAANRTLLQVLRDDLDLVGTKYGCGSGECGACTVLVQGDGQARKAILSCLTLAATMDGKSITTIAGLETKGKLHPVQEAFVHEHAVQCGYCTPGMVLKTVSLLEENPNPSETEIRQYLEGNICRCTGYNKIVQAVQTASKMS